MAALFVDGVRSDYSLYDKNLATYDEGDTFPHEAAPGFIELHSMQHRTWSRVQGPRFRACSSSKHGSGSFSRGCALRVY